MKKGTKHSPKSIQKMQKPKSDKARANMRLPKSEGMKAKLRFPHTDARRRAIAQGMWESPKLKAKRELAKDVTVDPLTGNMIFKKAEIRNAYEDRIAHYRDFQGHVENIYRPTKRFADKHDIPMIGHDEFLKWAINDPTYQRLYDDWKDHDFDQGLTPIVHRTSTQKPYNEAHMQWQTKDENYLGPIDPDLLKELKDGIDEEFRQLE